MNTLFLIPARGGSKGIPYKNIKLLNGKPLIVYSIEIARAITSDTNICVSTDDDQIISVVQNNGLKIPFKRSAELATDTATSDDVILHAINFYEQQGIYYDTVVLLQPTSPLRTVHQVKEAMALYYDKIDMVVSVKKSHAAAVLCNEDEKGFLQPGLPITASRRQDMPDYYEYNGAIYVINIKSLKEKGLSGFTRKVKYVMPEINSVDIDDMEDWKLAEMIVENFLLK
jgi:CMP-N,N'-diacetyllegionaminic acid synthase